MLNRIHVLFHRSWIAPVEKKAQSYADFMNNEREGNGWLKGNARLRQGREKKKPPHSFHKAWGIGFHKELDRNQVKMRIERFFTGPEIS